MDLIAPKLKSKIPVLENLPTFQKRAKAKPNLPATPYNAFRNFMKHKEGLDKQCLQLQEQMVRTANPSKPAPKSRPNSEKSTKRPKTPVAKSDVEVVTASPSENVADNPRWIERYLETRRKGLYKSKL